jgi:hypothetical protein
MYLAKFAFARSPHLNFRREIKVAKEFQNRDMGYGTRYTEVIFFHSTIFYL